MLGAERRKSMTKTRIDVLLSANLRGKMKICRILFIVLFCLFLQACYFFTAPMENPVIEDRVGLVFREHTSTLAITPDRRLLILDLNTNRFCAEPPAEVAQNISGALRAALKYKEVGVDVAKTLATAEKQLFFRSQGIQFFRDAAYYYCQLYLNGAIDEKSYVEKLGLLIPDTVNLIKQEIPYIPLYKYDTPPPLSGPIIPAPDGGKTSEQKKPEPPKDQTFSGTVSSKDVKAKTVVVKGKEGEKTFTVGDTTTKIMKEMSLADLEQGMNVSVSYKMEADKAMATAITVSAPKTAPKVAPKKTEEKPAETPAK
jgi:hypothetical protein